MLHVQKIKNTAFLFMASLSMAVLFVTRTYAAAWCPNIAEPRGIGNEQWFVNTETGETIENGDAIPTYTTFYWHRRGYADGSCTVMVPIGIWGDCILGEVQPRNVIKILGTLDTPQGDHFSYLDTNWGTPELNRSGGTVLDTTSATSTGPRIEAVGPGSYTFESAVIARLTECMIVPDEKWAEPTVIIGREPWENSCSKNGGLGIFGNPCDITSGVKLQNETDIRFGSLTLNRYYSSRLANIDLGHGHGWNSILTQRIERGISKINIVRQDGQSETFTLANGMWTGAMGTKYTVSSGVDGGYVVRSPVGWIEEYDRRGRLLKATARDGSFTRYAYTDSKLPVRVEDYFGRGLNILYSGRRIQSVTMDHGESIQYQYHATGSLASVIYGGNETRSYEYDARPFGKSASSALLSGIVDENGSRFAAWRYNAEAKVISSEHAPDSVATPTDKYAFTYNDGPFSGVSTATDPSGATWNVFYQKSDGHRLVAQQLNTVDGSSISQTFDAFGNRSSITDELGVRTCFARDLFRQVETHRLEGVPPEQTMDCLFLARYAGQIPTGSRRIVTAWHPDWDLVVKRSEPGRMTIYIYNGQPDPFNGNTPASCAPVSAVLPDGKPIAVLCRQVEQATTDTDGRLGLDAPLQSGAPRREHAWTYTAHGQVLSHDGPRTDVPDIETFTYYGDTTDDHHIGDLATVTNALGQTTRYAKYNAYGQVLRRIDPDGVATEFTYDARQRLTSVNAAGLTTTYAYDAVGQLKRASQPDGSFVDFFHDAAHRLVALSDGSGNRIDYTLDAAGQRTAEQTRDPAGELRRRVERVVDMLGRVRQAAGEL